MPATIGQRSRPASGETENGDRAVVIVRGATEIFGVIDALGHGPHAAHAARIALATLEESDATDLTTLFARVHAALRGTRGAAMTLLVTDGVRCESAGVGNVALRATGVRALASVSTPGVLGGQMRPLRIARGEHQLRSRVLVWSDGITSRLDLERLVALAPDEAAQRAMDEHAVAHDDATIIVADFDRRPR